MQTQTLGENNIKSKKVSLLRKESNIEPWTGGSINNDKLS